MNRNIRKKLFALTSALLVHTLCKIRKGRISKKRKPRQYSVRPVNRDRSKSFYYERFLPIKKQDSQLFFEHTRMNVATWTKLLNLIKPKLRKKRLSRFICEEERLAVTIHYLAHGSSMSELAIVYAMGKTTVCRIITETCSIIWNVLKPIHIPPLSDIDWKLKAEQYCIDWEMPNCCAAIDGKHITVQAPWKSGSANRNYKKFFSIQLMAACDAKLKFVYVNIGADGSAHDSAVFKETELAKMVDNPEYWPVDAVLPNSKSKIPFPFFFIGDAAFPLSKRLQRPYPGSSLTPFQEIYNYRLSRARRTIENSFGVLAKRWSLLQKPIIGRKRNIRLAVGAMTCLHNFLMDENARHDMLKPGQIHMDPELQKPKKNVANFSSRNARTLRDVLCNYLNTDGAVSWQWDILHRQIS